MEPVLVVGAGPTGLMMACELLRHGIPVRIIDKKAGPTQTTNAAGIHTRTVEIFEQIGIADKFVEEGLKCEYLQIYNDKKRLARIPLNTVDSHFNFLTLLPQSETEKILGDHLTRLGGQVERNVELVGLEQKNKQVISTLKYTDGRMETVVSDWVIGCDGYRSAVREQAKIEMTGSDINQEFFVADVRVKTAYEYNVVTMFLNRGTLLGLFPLPSATRDKFRIVANSNQIQNKDKFTDEEVKKIVQDYTQGECSATEILWSSPFWIHSRLAAALQNGSVFIAGDAAHVHSPAGAQGMNTGLQDAFNLAWKLALVIKGQADPKILPSYQSERYPIIKTIVFATEKMAIFGLTKNPFLIAFRNFMFKHVANKVKFLQKKVIGRVSQISLKYNKSHLIDKSNTGHKEGPQPGERTPDVTLKNGKRLYDALRNTQHNMLLFTGPAPTPDTIAAIEAAYREIESAWGSLIIPHVVSEKQIDVPHQIEDPDLAIHHRYHVSQPSLCLIRPDQYIAYFTGSLETKTLTHFLQQVGFNAR